MSHRGSMEQVGAGFAAEARACNRRMVEAVKGTCENHASRPALFEHGAVHATELPRRGLPFGKVRLVRNEKQEVARRLKPGKGNKHTGDQRKLTERARRLPAACIRVKAVAVDHSVTIEKGCSPASWRGFQAATRPRSFPTSSRAHAASDARPRCARPLPGTTRYGP